MSNGKHSFVQMTKLTNVRGRVYYISSPKRQENLYATYTNVPNKCWYHLAKENQRDFNSSGTKGKCIEARELVIMLPPSLYEYDHELLLKYFSSVFTEKYDVPVNAALHHNKKKTNFHIHLIFSERRLLDEPERKIAKRNMFYDENGKHVRTKKEILDEEGNVRPGCKIIKKGEVYETNLFAPKDPQFKSKAFLKEAKVLFTEVCNELVKDENEKLTVFAPGGPYLPTKKIGKNNPKEQEIKDNNHLRQEWNRMVDRGLIAGMSEEELVEIKKEHIDKEVAESVKVHGNQPNLFTQLLQKAIGKLRALIDFFVILQNAEKDENGEALLYEDVVLDITPAALPAKDRGPYPSSELEKLEVIKLENIDKKLKSGSRKVYAIEKNVAGFQEQLKKVPKGFFHRKERKALVDSIATKLFELEKAKSNLDTIPMMHGFANAASFYKAFKKAKADLAEKEKLQEEWRQLDSSPAKEYMRVPANAKKEPIKQTQREEKRSVRARLAENKEIIAKQSQNPEKDKSKNRDCL